MTTIIEVSRKQWHGNLYMCADKCNFLHTIIIMEIVHKVQ